MEEHETHK